ncbi:MAG TPA: hypothetical protein VIT91_02565, partial [Chthoniobacterales bacterium]
MRLSGGWTSATTSVGYFGSNFSTDSNTGKGFAAAEFLPSFAQSGLYEVFVRYPAHPSASQAVPFTVSHWGGVSNLLVNERQGGGTWVSIGRYYFEAGGRGKVKLTNAGTTGYVFADAVAFSLVEAVPGDSDGDGLADGWELAVFGDLDETASADLDSDGLSNVEEMAFGSNPL